MIRRDAVIVAALTAYALTWAYGSDNAPFDPLWTLPLAIAHFGAGLLIGRWRALLIPGVIILLSIPAPTPPGADSTTFGHVLIYEVLFGLGLVAAGILVGRGVAGKGLFTDPDPWR
jgi:hypothetical protein